MRSFINQSIPQSPATNNAKLNFCNASNESNIQKEKLKHVSTYLIELKECREGIGLTPRNKFEALSKRTSLTNQFFGHIATSPKLPSTTRDYAGNMKNSYSQYKISNTGNSVVSDNDRVANDSR